MSAKSKLYLSLLGVFLSIVGFYVSNASSFPLVQQILAPSYVRAKAGIARIQREGAIQWGHPEFPALAEIVETKLAEQNKNIPRSAIVLERLEATGGGITFGRTTSRQVVGLKVILRGQQQPVQWDLLKLTDVVEGIWSSRSLSWATWVFWIGVAQTVWPLFIKTRVKRNHRPEASNAA
ncbi:MAG: hypothetical protein IH999_04275 [Proteobacteria bacterium]|nr:hypothetical protein [Pseudomonadota bacterium]